MEFVITPYVGAGVIELGMTRDEVKNVLNATPERFKKSIEDAFETDMYEECFVHYKEPGICDAIEFFNPAKVIFEGLDLFSLTYKELEEWFRNIDSGIKTDGAGLISHKYGVGIYAPFAIDDPLEKPEGVAVVDRDHYSRVLS